MPEIVLNFLHSSTPITKHYWTQNVNSTEVENPRPKLVKLTPLYCVFSEHPLHRAEYILSCSLAIFEVSNHNTQNTKYSISNSPAVHYPVNCQDISEIRASLQFINWHSCVSRDYLQACLLKKMWPNSSVNLSWKKSSWSREWSARDSELHLPLKVKPGF